MRGLRTSLARWIAPHGDLDPVIAKVEIAKLRLAPGDYLVVFMEELLTVEHRQKLKAILEGLVEDHKVLVCDGDMRLGIIRKTGG